MYMAEAQNAVLLDVRNVYESRIGYFSVPGIKTIRPPLRQFSDFPRHRLARIPCRCYPASRASAHRFPTSLRLMRRLSRASTFPPAPLQCTRAPAPAAQADTCTPVTRPGGTRRVACVAAAAGGRFFDEVAEELRGKTVLMYCTGPPPAAPLHPRARRPRLTRRRRRPPGARWIRRRRRRMRARAPCARVPMTACSPA